MAETKQDRELIELLNELRVVLPGIQVMFAVLLIVPFSQGFVKVTEIQKNVYFMTFLCTAAATALVNWAFVICSRPTMLTGPETSSRSSTQTLWPRLAIDHAAARPTTPAPMTARGGHCSPAAGSDVHTHALLPSWSAITVYDGAWLSSTTIPPAATAAAIRCSATSGGTHTSTWNR